MNTCIRSLFITGLLLATVSGCTHTVRFYSPPETQVTVDTSDLPYKQLNLIIEFQQPVEQKYGLEIRDAILSILEDSYPEISFNILYDPQRSKEQMEHALTFRIKITNYVAIKQTGIIASYNRYDIKPDPELHKYNRGWMGYTSFRINFYDYRDREKNEYTEIVTGEVIESGFLKFGKAKKALHSAYSKAMIEMMAEIDHHLQMLSQDKLQGDR